MLWSFIYYIFSLLVTFTAVVLKTRIIQNFVAISLLSGPLFFVVTPRKTVVANAILPFFLKQSIHLTPLKRFWSRYIFSKMNRVDDMRHTDSIDVMLTFKFQVVLTLPAWQALVHSKNAISFRKPLACKYMYNESKKV